MASISGSTISASPAADRRIPPRRRLMARFFFVQDPDGYKIEVLQTHGRYHCGKGDIHLSPG
jgi:hypothetical protein